MQQATIIPVDYKSLYESSLVQIEQLKLQLAQLQKMVFGSRHERFIPDSAAVAQQLVLSLQAEAVGERTVTTQEVTVMSTWL